MARVAYFVHGRGRGHASRARAVLPRLRGEGHDVHVFAGGHALALLVDHGPREVRACVPGPGLARTWLARLRHDVGALAEIEPDVVISDGDGPSIHAALTLGLPRLAVGHGLLFRHAELPGGLSTLARARETLNAASSSWPAARRVVVHFAPVRARTRGTVIARPELRDGLARARDEGFVLAYFRDGDGERWLRALVARGHRVVCFGAREVPRGVEGHDADPVAFADALARCSAVVGSAGNHLPAECALLGVPMLALHGRRDVEHAMNARLLAHAGIGVAGALDDPTERLLRTLEGFRPAPSVTAAVRAMPSASEAIASEVARLAPSAARLIVTPHAEKS